MRKEIADISGYTVTDYSKSIFQCKVLTHFVSLLVMKPKADVPDLQKSKLKSVLGENILVCVVFYLTSVQVMVQLCAVSASF